LNLLEKLNYSAYEYYMANLPNFLQICHPLFDLGVKCFCYVKIFEDGSYLSFSNNKEFTKEYFFNVKSQGNTFTSDIESTSQEQELNVIYPSNISLYDKNKDSLAHLAFAHDIWHHYGIYKNKLNFVELYSFSMNVKDEYAPQFYLQNLYLLKHFCRFFNERSADLINADDRKKRAYFQQQFNLTNISDEDKWAQKAEQFLLRTQLQRLTVQGTDKEVLLSKRETECLHYLALGKSVKEIARSLSLSPRTIEFYLKNIKNKTGHVNKTQVISAYLKLQPAINCLQTNKILIP